MFCVLVANVTEAGDIVVLALVLALTFVIGLALLALDTAVGRIHARREGKVRPPRRSDPANGNGGA